MNLRKSQLRLPYQPKTSLQALTPRQQSRSTTIWVRISTGPALAGYLLLGVFAKKVFRSAENKNVMDSPGEIQNSNGHLMRAALVEGVRKWRQRGVGFEMEGHIQVRQRMSHRASGTTLMVITTSGVAGVVGTALMDNDDGAEPPMSMMPTMRRRSWIHAARGRTWRRNRK